MLDEDDLDFAILVGPGGWFGILLVIIIAIFVYRNTEECEARHCDHGKPVLMRHECLCVDEAPPKEHP